MYEGVILERFNIGTDISLWILGRLGLMAEVSNNNLEKVEIDMNNCCRKIERSDIEETRIAIQETYIQVLNS